MALKRDFMGRAEHIHIGRACFLYSICMGVVEGYMNTCLGVLSITWLWIGLGDFGSR